MSGAGYPIYRSQFPHSNAVIKVEEDGSKAVLFTGEADIGQGSDLILVQILAEELGLKLENVTLKDLGKAKRIVIDKDNLLGFVSRVTPPRYAPEMRLFQTSVASSVGGFLRGQSIQALVL